MNCFWGQLQSLGSYDAHSEGHRVGNVVRMLRPTLYNSLAVMSMALSELSKLGLDEAFAEGYVNGDPLFIMSISHYIDVDPTTLPTQSVGVEVGALDIISAN